MSITFSRHWVHFYFILFHCSCGIEADIDNGIFNSKSYSDFVAGYDYDRETAGSSANFYSVSNKDHHDVASYVAKHRHTITVRDIRRPDPRFEDGSICLQVRNIEYQTTINDF